MLLTLCEYAVPLQRAIWFIKMTSFYHESKVAESKIKKRQQPDLSQGELGCSFILAILSVIMLYLPLIVSENLLKLLFCELLVNVYKISSTGVFIRLLAIFYIFCYRNSCLQLFAAILNLLPNF